MVSSPWLEQDYVGPGVEQQEVPGPVCVLCLSRAQADLTDHGCVLVAQVGAGVRCPRAASGAGTWPKWPDEGSTSGSISLGTPNNAKSSSSHDRVRRSINMVRLALVTSVR